MNENRTERNPGGRPRAEVSQEAFGDALRRFRAHELTMEEAAAACGIGRSAFYRRVKEAEEPKKSFTEILKETVSDSDTGRETLEYIPYDRIEPDPDNFYSLDHLEELAGNIELVGLQQPLRVRENENGGYTVVSGHRRLAAIVLINEGGSDMFADGVPCIVENEPVSEAMRELRLIYANSSTRVMSSAEISHQAERVTALLYQLQEQGVSFPGRMRDHVAEACKISKTKLARLHAIRANLVPDLLALYDAGTIPEETAYQLGRLPKELQDAVAEAMTSGKRKNPPVGGVVERVAQQLEKLQEAPSCRAHAGGPACHNVTGRLVRSLYQPYYWQICEKNCCLDCYKAREGCSGACQEARSRAKLEKDAEAEKQAERTKAAEAEREATKKQVVKRCRELLPLIDAAGLEDNQKLYDHYEAATAGDVRKWAADGAGSKTFWSDACVKPPQVQQLQAMAARLRVPASQLLGEKPVSESDTVPEATWKTGTPPRPGRYFCRVDMETTKPIENRCEWDGTEWSVYGVKLQDKWKIVGWWPLPKEG